MKTYQFILFLSVFGFLYGCKEDEPTNPEVESVHPIEAILTSHAWRFNEEFSTLINGQSNSYQVPSCLLDDSLVYRSDERYIKYAGAQLCATQNQAADTLSWALIKDTTLITSANGVETVKTIKLVNSDSLLLQSVSPQSDTMFFLYLER